MSVKIFKIIFCHFNSICQKIIQNFVRKCHFLMNDSKKLSFQEQIIETIKNGDLQQFKKLFITKTEINRKLLPYQILNSFPKTNKNESYTCPKGPTPLMYSIICEQDEIVDFILKNKNPDLTISSEGYSPLHLAAMVKDSHMIEALLEYKYFQDNVDNGVDFDTLSTDLGFTSALHIAVSNHRYMNVYRLLSPFKRPIDAGEAEIRPQFLSANVNLESASGSTALHIALFLRDVDMIKLLLSFNASRLVENADGKTVIDLINEDEDDPFPPEIKSIIQDAHFIDSYSPIKVMHEIYPDNPEFYIETDNSQNKEPEITNNQIYSMLTQIMEKLDNLENRVSKLEEKDEKMKEETYSVCTNHYRCKNCGNPGYICPQCHGCYCSVCIQKPQFHPCIK